MKHPWCDLVYLTDIMADFDCDVFFPELDRKLFVLQNRYNINITVTDYSYCTVLNRVMILSLG